MKEKLSEDIVKLLMSEESYVSANFIAKKLDVNEKTIRRKITLINQLLQKDIGCITSKKGRGYRIQISNQEAFSKYYDYHIAEVEWNSPINRRASIFDYIIDNTKRTKLDIQDKFFISEATLNNDIKILNQYCAHVNVTVKYHQKNGYFIEGSEYHIRNTILRLGFDRGDVGIRRRESRKMKDNLVNAVRSVFFGEGYYINKHTLDAIVNYLLIEARPIKSVKKLPIENNINYEKIGREFFCLSSQLHNVLEKLLNQKYTENQTVFLSYFLKSVMPLEMVKMYHEDKAQIQRVNRYYEIVRFCLDYIGFKENDESFEEDVKKYFYSFIIRVELDIQKREKYYLKIEKTHKQAYWLSKIIFKYISKEFNYKVSKEEIAYFSMIITQYFFPNTKRNKRILAIIPSDYTIARVYKNELRHFVDFDIEYITYQDYTQSTNVDDKNYALLLNPFDYLSPKPKLKAYSVYDVITTEDFMNISRIVAYINYEKVLENLNKIQEIDKQFSFEKLIDKMECENAFFTTFFGSIICFADLEDECPMKYQQYHHDFSMKAIIIINKKLPYDQKYDLLRIAVDIVLKLNSKIASLELEEVIKIYTK